MNKVNTLSQKNSEKHWLYRLENRKKLWMIQFGILILALIPEFFMHHHASFEAQGVHLDASPTFYAWYGFLTCAAMVVGAKILALILKRKDNYYDDFDNENDINNDAIDSNAKNGEQS